MVHLKPVFSTYMAGIVLRPGRHKKYIAGKVPEIGDWKCRWVGKGKGEEQTQRTCRAALGFKVLRNGGK